MKLKRATETITQIRKQARGFFDRMLSGDVEGLPTWQVKLSVAMRVLSGAGKELVRDGCFGRASSLAYQTLVALIPVIAISMALFTALPALSQKKEVFLEWVTDTLLPVPEAAEDEPTAEGTEFHATREAIEQAREDVRIFFRSTVEALAARAGAVEGVGGIALFLIVMSLMYNVERTYNDLWAVEVRRGLVARLMYFTAMGFWALVLLGISFYASAWLHRAVAGAPSNETVIFVDNVRAAAVETAEAAPQAGADVMFDFESEAELERFDLRGVKAELSDEHVTSGTRSVKLTYLPDKGLDVFMWNDSRHPFDLSEGQNLMLDVYSEVAVDFAVKLKSDRGARKWKRNVTVEPGGETVVLPFADMDIDPKSVSYFNIYMGAPGFLQKTFFGLMPFVVTSLVLAALYKITPHVKVQWKAALAGGAVAGVLWEVTKVFMGWYFTSVVSYAKIYGAMGALPIFMAWIYVSWVILLYGAELSYCVQSMPLKPSEDHSSSWRAYRGTLVMYEIGSAFAEGRGALEVEAVAGKLDMSPEAVRGLCRELADAALLAEVWSGETLVGYMPGRSLSKLSLGEVVRAIRGEGLEAPEAYEGHPVGRVFRTAAREERSRLEMTFEELIEGHGAT